ncbi:MAG: hypothetical protein HUJ78_00965 [Mogibacterium sp.]|nr:hypothetical protein [Mogibacterium sp.]
MHEYQIRSMECYVLPRTVYMQCIWLVRDIDRMKAFVGDDANRDADMFENIESRIRTVEDALMTIPEEYRQGIVDNIVLKKSFKDYAHENTWRRWKQQFLYELAVRMKII